MIEHVISRSKCHAFVFWRKDDIVFTSIEVDGTLVVSDIVLEIMSSDISDTRD